MVNLKNNRTYLIGLIFFISTNLQSQNIYKLDQIYGFKDFKFDTPISAYKSFKLRKGYSKSNDGLDYYKISGEDYSLTLGETKIDNIELHEYKDKIVRIDLMINDRIYNNLKKSFGKPNKKEYSKFDSPFLSMNDSESAIWSSNRVMMEYYASIERKYDETFKTYFDSYQTTITFKINRYNDIVEDVKKESLNEFSNDFGGSISEKIEPEYEIEPNINIVYILNKKWYQGGGFGINSTGDMIYRDKRNGKIIEGLEILTSENKYTDYSIDYSMTRFYIAANKSKKVICLWNEVKDNSTMMGETFKGPIKIFLENGEVITCYDRKINGSQNTEEGLVAIFSLYYLTDSEFDQLQNNEIIGINYRYGDRYNGVQNYSLGKDAFGNQTITYDIKEIKKLLRLQGNP